MTSAAVEELDRRRDIYLKDKDNSITAQDFASEVRIFLEARLTDMFDDAAYPAYSLPSKAPTLADFLGRLRGLVATPPNALFRSKAVTDFAACKSLAPGATCLKVLNKSHHNKATLSAGEVFTVLEELDQVRKLAEKMHTDFRLWRWREPLQESIAEPSAVSALSTVQLKSFSAPIHPDLTAFTNSSIVGSTQDTFSDILTESWFSDKALFYIRTDNLGFSLPSGCIAIVEREPYEGKDHNIAIVRHFDNILARRIFRSQKGSMLSLASEAPDPRSSKPTLSFDSTDIIVHRIVGMLAEKPPPPYGKGEATEIATAASLEAIKAAYRVREDSGIPLALPGQVVIGGEMVLPSQLASLEGELVALALSDGRNAFKRVGKPIRGSGRLLWQFESIGGLGSSLVVSLDQVSESVDQPLFLSARRVLGVLYTA